MTDAGARWHRAWHLWPRSLLGRLVLVMGAGVLLMQFAAAALWVQAGRTKARQDTQQAAAHLGRSAANAIRYFGQVPPAYRPLLLQQFREMGGTRFFVALGQAMEPVAELPPQELLAVAQLALRSTLADELPNRPDARLAFVAPQQLVVSGGTRLTDLPEHWVRDILLSPGEAAPVAVIQAELEPGHWLFLAALMPDPYFLRAADPLATERLLLQALPVVLVLLLTAGLLLRWITHPLAALASAAQRVGTEEQPLPVQTVSASAEVQQLALAFEQMRERIRRYLADRERLFIAISHDLRTPITRLKLRTELLEDEPLRRDFEEDLDELDMMVKGALQSVKDSEIHEDLRALRLAPLLGRLAGGARLAGHELQLQLPDPDLQVRAKPLALKRALGNLVDNALHYGEHVEVSARQEGDWVEIAIRDHGPGVPPEALASLFEPHLRLAHGRARNQAGLGLGLGIARSIVEAQGGTLRLDNHSEGGLVASVRLPAPRSEPQ